MCHLLRYQLYLLYLVILNPDLKVPLTFPFYLSIFRLTFFQAVLQVLFPSAVPKRLKPAIIFIMSRKKLAKKINIQFLVVQLILRMLFLLQFGKLMKLIVKLIVLKPTKPHYNLTRPLGANKLF